MPEASALYRSVLSGLRLATPKDSEDDRTDDRHAHREAKIRKTINLRDVGIGRRAQDEYERQESLDRRAFSHIFMVLKSSTKMSLGPPASITQHHLSAPDFRGGEIRDSSIDGLAPIERDVEPDVSATSAGGDEIVLE
jgi:hypothetical protein